MPKGATHPRATRSTWSGASISTRRWRCCTRSASRTKRWPRRRCRRLVANGRRSDRQPPSERPSAGAAAQRGHARWTLVTCVLASSLSFVEGSVLNVALPAIRGSYQASAQEVQWVVNAYLLPLSALLLLGGALGDHYGRRRLLIIGTSIFAAASLVCALAPSLNVLLAARGVQGIGAALLLPNSLALLNAAYSGEAARPRGRDLGGVGRRRGRGRAADRRLAGRQRRLAVDLLHQPAAGCRRHRAGDHSSSRRAATPAAGRTDYAGALLATAGLGGVTYALTFWSASGRVSATVSPGGARRCGDAGGVPVGRASPRRQGDDAARHVHRPLLRRPQPADLPALRRVRGGDAADPLCADRSRRLFAGAGRDGDAAAADHSRRRLAHDGRARRATWARGCR